MDMECSQYLIELKRAIIQRKKSLSLKYRCIFIEFLHYNNQLMWLGQQWEQYWFECQQNKLNRMELNCERNKPQRSDKWIYTLLSLSPSLNSIILLSHKHMHMSAHNHYDCCGLEVYCTSHSIRLNDLHFAEFQLAFHNCAFLTYTHSLTSEKKAVISVESFYCGPIQHVVFRSWNCVFGRILMAYINT